jgi:hypothetical protein
MFVGYRRDPNPKGRGAEGANPGIRMKLSGKRTVTRARPGKIQPCDFVQGWTPTGKNPESLRDNLSGQKTGGRRWRLVVFLLFLRSISEQARVIALLFGTTTPS